VLLLLRLGNDAFTAKQYREALRLYSEALKLDSHNAALYSNKSACYASLQLWDESAKEARQSVSIDPNFIKAYGRLATAEIELGQYDAALTTLRTALSKDPGNELVFCLAIVLSNSIW
jgi:stress-induced-phosphoprotein 1